MYKEHFANKLKAARKEAGYNQQQVEDTIGINRSTLSRYESGQREPDIETLGILADFYEVSLDWLVGTKGNNK
jgi:transcriptional regulator with XRE-family HTH domain